MAVSINIGKMADLSLKNPSAIAVAASPLLQLGLSYVITHTSSFAHMVMAYEEVMDLDTSPRASRNTGRV